MEKENNLGEGLISGKDLFNDTDDYDFDAGLDKEDGLISGKDLVNDPMDPENSDEYQEDDYDFFPDEGLYSPIQTSTINVGQFGRGDD
jgi:hypothetical protein